MKTFFWIVEYFASFVELFMCGVFCGSFLVKEKIGEKKYLLVLGSFIGSCFVLILNSIDIFSFMNTILILLIVYFMQIIIYRTKYALSFLLILIYTVLLTAIDFMTAFFAALILNKDVVFLLNVQSTSRLLCILMSKSMVILIVLTLNKTIKKSVVFMKKYVLIMCFYSIFLLSSFFVMTELNMDSENVKIDLFLIGFFVISIIIELLMFYLIIKTGERYEQRKEVELIQMKNDMLQKSLDETEQAFKMWRRSVHDYKNNVIALKQLADDGDIDKIKAYLENESELIETQMFYIKTGNSTVDTIVNTKQRIAEENGIIFVINASIPSNCCISEMDFANILGNIIDNAIEASQKEKEPYIDLTIRQDKNFIVIKIINKCCQKISEQLETTKKRKRFHGIGISSVQECIKKYEGEFSLEKRGNEVIVKILIPNY